jgi:hypothetical protein
MTAASIPAAGALAQLALALASGRVRVVDLTHTLSPDFPTIVLPPEFGHAHRSAWKKFPATMRAARRGIGTRSP